MNWKEGRRECSFLRLSGVISHLESRLAILLFLLNIRIKCKLVFLRANCMCMLIAMAASVLSLVLPLVNTETTTWLSQ